MSQIEHRKRLQEQRRKIAEFQPQNSTFKPAKNVGPIHTPAPLLQSSVAAPAPAVPAPTVVSTEQPSAPPEYQQQATLPADPNTVVLPRSESMTPEQMRNQARTTAEMLAGLESEQYNAALLDLERTNPNFYAVVVDELNNMNAEAEAAEGDGEDINALMGGNQPQHDAVNPNPTAGAEPKAGESQEQQ